MKKIKQCISSTTPDDIVFCRSAPNFDFASTSVDLWNDGNSAKSHFWNAISCLLPNFEYIAVQSAARALPRIQNEKLRNDAIIFCQQEKAHAHSHEQFNELLLKKYPGLKRVERFERWCLKKLLQLAPQRFLLAIFVAVEHITSSLGEIGLEDPDLWFKNSDAHMYALWEWHAYEEVAHKAVCFDCHRAIDGGYLSRIIGMVFAFIFLLLPGVVVRQIYMSWRSGEIHRLNYWGSLIKHLFGKGGVFRESFGKIKYYFSVRFSPWNVDSRNILTNYIQREKSYS